MIDSTQEPLTLFFDLDGTLSDPSEGITKSVQHALEYLGRPYPSKSELQHYIGPPLRWTFPRLRVDQLMRFEWKFLMPLSLLNLAVGAVIVTAGWYFLV